MGHNVTAHQSEPKCTINSEARLGTPIIAYSPISLEERS